MTRKSPIVLPGKQRVYKVSTGLRKESHDIYAKEGESRLATLFKIDETGASAQQAATGERRPPFDMAALYDLQVANIHHARCLRTKRAATVGLGWSSADVAEALDPLCRISWQDTLDSIADDFFNTGGGWLEVVRVGDRITGLHHVRSRDVCFVIEDRINHHYAVQSEGLGRIVFAPFGESSDFTAARASKVTALGLGGAPIGQFGELIYFRQPSAMDPYFGWPDFLAAVPSIELVQMNHMDRFDWHNNRGVPEMMLFIFDPNISGEKWTKIDNALKGSIGLGNKHKTFSMQLGIESKVQVERMALPQEAGSFESENNALAMEIVSAHGVPPLLAGIQIPGKLGSNNELPNALMAFQSLVIGQAQMIIEQTLAVTLGDPARNGGLPLTREDFLGKHSTDPMTGKSKKVGGLRTILDEIDIGLAATVGGMKQPVAEANAQGRDLGAGLKD